MERAKYFLHGGATGKDTERNHVFFREIIDSVGNKPINILLIYFARAEGVWRSLFEEDMKKFTEASFRRGLHNIEVGDINVGILSDQIKEANIIFIRGGDTDKLRRKMDEVANLEDLLQGKVIAGSSAGAYILSSYYYANSKNEIKQGMGILPIKIFAHYSDDQIDNFRKLEMFGPDMPVLKIEEADFEVYT